MSKMYSNDKIKLHIRGNSQNPDNRNTTGYNGTPRYSSIQSRLKFKHRPRIDKDLRTKLAAKLIKRDNHDYTSNEDSNVNRSLRSIIFRNKEIQIKSGPMPLRRPHLQSDIRSKTYSSGEISWYKISTSFGNKYDKDYIIHKLLKITAPLTFIPIMYRVIGQEAVFYVDDQRTASTLLDCDRKITTPDNFKISVKVKPGYPNCQIDETLKTKLKIAMARRYITANKALDLSCFHHDPELVENHFCALFRPEMMMTVLEIAGQAIPNLEALNLDNNRLSVLEKLNVLQEKFANLKVLHIGDNKIRSLHQIDELGDLKLNEFRLEGNPLCDRYQNRFDDYVRDIRERFPKLLRLDGVELPKPISFDVSDEGTKIPLSHRVFTANAKAQEIAYQFMQQYFTIFDGESRQPLLDAYHEQAVFDLVITPCSTIHEFKHYFDVNRNLFRINDVTKRKRLLKQGRLSVVSCISEIPKTRHFSNTFTMDIALVTDTMMVITVTGIFKEIGTKDEPLRYFDRTFIIVPEGTGYCIKNEQLQLSPPTFSQANQMIEGPTVTFIPEPVANVVATPSSNSASEPTDETKNNMAIELSRMTNMNLNWSLKCLREVKWSFTIAVSAFNEFFQRGQIPQEAFEK
ncbi:nuclear RNA export factor 1-like [Chelonus insularis]|uniref:nuclear RNA export factor 1-like n=1 Tax=Chelonus insularis TaxID=460826 RepID=UPI00158C78A0|nr:nuclear RNA export factor 1-like [Chelonus insularis]XP_034934465.1 nuclear RNA export factor 1-like [Chelonus insularis]